MRLLEKVVLDSKALAQQPLNAYLHYRLPPQKKQRGGPVDIRIQALSRLPAMLADGFDSQPLEADEMAFWLDGLSEAWAWRSCSARSRRRRSAATVSSISSTAWLIFSMLPA